LLDVLLTYIYSYRQYLAVLLKQCATVLSEYNITNSIQGKFNTFLLKVLYNTRTDKAVTAPHNKIFFLFFTSQHFSQQYKTSCLYSSWYGCFFFSTQQSYEV